MINLCPNCGHELPHELNHCLHCNHLIDSSDFNKLLSAAWQTKKENLSLEQIKWNTKLDDDLSILVYTYIQEQGYSHEDFIRLLKKLGVANKAYLTYS